DLRLVRYEPHKIGPRRLQGPLVLENEPMDGEHRREDLVVKRRVAEVAGDASFLQGMQCPRDVVPLVLAASQERAVRQAGPSRRSERCRGDGAGQQELEAGPRHRGVFLPRDWTQRARTAMRYISPASVCGVSSRTSMNALPIRSSSKR